VTMSSLSMTYVAVVFLLETSGSALVPVPMPVDSSARADSLDGLRALGYASAAQLVSQASVSPDCATPLTGKLCEVRLLAWRALEVNRRRVEEVVWWARWVDSLGKDFWVLAYGYCHPREAPPTGGTWRLCCTMDSSYLPRRIYSTRPANSDIVSLVLDRPWFQPPSSGSRVLEAIVRPRTWRAAVGTHPPPGFRP